MEGHGTTAPGCCSSSVHVAVGCGWETGQSVSGAKRLFTAALFPVISHLNAHESIKRSYHTPHRCPLNIGVQPLLILSFAGGEVCHDSSAAVVNHPGGL